MMVRWLPLVALLALTACYDDETVSGYADKDAIWTLTELDGAAFDATATLTFPEEGKVAGDAPCNSFFGTQTAPYPWISIEQIGATRMACPDLPLETEYLTALSDMTLAEVAGDTLILSNDAGREMVFRRQP